MTMKRALKSLPVFTAKLFHAILLPALMKMKYFVDSVTMNMVSEIAASV